MTDDAIARDYLAGWADPRKHTITAEPWKDAAGDENYIAVCACGWRAIPVVWRSQIDRRCPVQDALQERAERMRDARHAHPR